MKLILKNDPDYNYLSEAYYSDKLPQRSRPISRRYRLYRRLKITNTHSLFCIKLIFLPHCHKIDESNSFTFISIVQVFTFHSNCPCVHFHFSHQPFICSLSLFISKFTYIFISQAAQVHLLPRG